MADSETIATANLKILLCLLNSAGGILYQVPV